MSQGIEVKSNLELKKAAAYLEDIARSLREGHICVEHAGESLELCPPDSVNVEIKARRKEHKESIELRVSWRTKVAEDAPEPELRISSTPAPESADQPASAQT